MGGHAPNVQEDVEEQYTVRTYDPGDASDVLSLFESVWGTDRDSDWLAAAYLANPYADGVTMVVADDGSRVVGARPFVPFPMGADGIEFPGVYLHNAMVHPDHRRRGLFTRMTERVLADHADSAAVAFCFANELSAPSYRDLGFEAVGTRAETFLRVQSPGNFVRQRLPSTLGDVAAGAADAAADRYLSFRRRRQQLPGSVDVARHPGVLADCLAELYAADPPTAFHTRREAPLYQWLAANPYWEYETYVASRDDPVAAVVVRSQAGDEATAAWLVDAVPPADRRERAAFAALLDAVVADHADAPAIATTAPVTDEQLFPDGLLASFGFVSKGQPLVDRFTADNDDVLLASGFDDEALSTLAVDIANPSHWRVLVE